MTTATPQVITIAGRAVDYRIVRSKTAKKLRIRVSLSGVDVIQPAGRAGSEVSEFLAANGAWIVEQLARLDRYRSIRRPTISRSGSILFRGEQTAVAVETHPSRGGQNQVRDEGTKLVIIQSAQSVTPPARTLENWLRKQARVELLKQLELVVPKVGRQPGKVFIMGQRTKWGNCSALQNLSFNWRLIMAPGFVLRYLVTHEAVHLAVPDHSSKFWLTVRSLCPETERAKQWLSANSQSLTINLSDVCRC